jgi:hypothetical protein
VTGQELRSDGAGDGAGASQGLRGACESWVARMRGST